MTLRTETCFEACVNENVWYKDRVTFCLSTDTRFCFAKLLRQSEGYSPECTGRVYPSDRLSNIKSCTWIWLIAVHVRLGVNNAKEQNSANHCTKILNRPLDGRREERSSPQTRPRSDLNLTRQNPLAKFQPIYSFKRQEGGSASPFQEATVLLVLFSNCIRLTFHLLSIATLHRTKIRGNDSLAL